MLPAATGWLTCGPKSWISQPSSLPVTFYSSVKPGMCFPLVAPTSSLPTLRPMKHSGDKGWQLITISLGQRQPEGVVGNSSTRDSGINEFLFGGVWPFHSTMLYVHLFVNVLMLTQLQSFRKKDEGQLGLPQFPKTTFPDVPFPVELHLPGIYVASLALSHKLVHIPSLPSTNTLISCYSYIFTGVPMHLLLMAVCMSGVGAFDPSILH